MTGARWWVCVVGACVAACHSTSAVTGGPEGRAEAPMTSSWLARLALVATQRAPGADELARTAREVEADPAALALYIDRLLGDRRFSRAVAPSLFGVAGALHTAGYVLQESRTADGAPLYYLREPCAPERAELVQPWWAATTMVRVCPDSHRPDYLSRPGTEWQCGSAKLGLEVARDCGCGPHLARCFRDPAHRDAIRVSLRAENARTIAWILEHDLPVEALFTSNASFRDHNAELVYTNWRVLDGEAVAYPDPADWPDGGKWAPRAERRPGMHAGILTTPATLLSADATRALLRQLYELLWCKAPTSSHVDAETIWSLGVTDLRDGAGWQRLAAMPVCTSCHARLDHGVQFFTGFPGKLRADHYTAALQRAGMGPLYGDDIADPRGVAERTPQGFARAVTAQGEFAACMVERVGRHVFGGAPPPEAEQAMREAFARSHHIRDLVRVALLRAAALWRQPARQPAAPPWPPGIAAPADAHGDVALPVALRGELERWCAECHDDGPNAFTGRAALPRPVLQRMLQAVAYGDMPRDAGALSSERRRALVGALIATVFADEPSRAIAGERFDAALRRRSAVSEAARRAAVHAQAGVPAAAWPRLDVAYGPASPIAGPAGSSLSPAMAVDLATAALADCAWLGVADRDACLDRALRIDALVTPDAE